MIEAFFEMPDTEFNADQIQRAVIQRLEDMRRAGVTHWKKIAPVSLPQPTLDPPSRMTAAPPSQMTSTPIVHSSKSADPGHGAVVPPSRSDAAPVSPPHHVQHSVQTNNLSGESESSEVAKKRSVAPSPKASTCATFQPLDLPLAERVTGLAALAQRVAQCTRCQELSATRTQTVFGTGNPQAKILFIGEAPGADEDKKGEPFVGRAGQLLNDIITACRLRREEIYICNVLRCRPPGNRLPAPDEAANCREYLDGQIAHVNPEYIVCWGTCAAQNLLGVTDTIGKMRGRFYKYGEAKVLCTYHPSYLLRNPAAKKDVWEDMKLLFLDMGIDLTAKA